MSKPERLAFVYTTLPNVAEADRIAAVLVELGIAACVNIHPGMRSVYRWEGEVQHEEEVGAFIKTRWTLADKVMETVRRMHPYDVPALAVLPIEKVSDDYLAWALAQTES